MREGNRGGPGGGGMNQGRFRGPPDVVVQTETCKHPYRNDLCTPIQVEQAHVSMAASQTGMSPHQLTCVTPSTQPSLTPVNEGPHPTQPTQTPVNEGPHPSPSAFSPMQDPAPNAQVPPALAQVGEVGAPITVSAAYPVPQVADVQVPAKALVALPAQLYPAGAMQAAAEGAGQCGQVKV